MSAGKSIYPGRFGRIFQAILLSLTIHVLLFGFGYFILDRGKAIDREIPEKLAVRFAAPHKVLLSTPEQRSRDINETGQNDLFSEPSTDIDRIPDHLPAEPSKGIEGIRGDLSEKPPTGIDETGNNEPASNDAADFTGSVLRPWEIDVPPALSVPGNMGDEKDDTPLLDALPLVASVYLNEFGTPFLILYNPMPNNEALRRLNRFFASSTFFPAMVQNQPVPSVLNLPLSVKGLTP